MLRRKLGQIQIYFDQVNVGELIVESGCDTNIQLWEIAAESVLVKEPELKAVDIIEILPQIKDESLQQSIIDLFLKNKEMNNRMLSVGPKINLMEGAEIEQLIARANVAVDFSYGHAEKLILEATDMKKAKVVCSNYDGDIVYNGNGKSVVTELQLVDSMIDNLTVSSGDIANWFNVDSNKSTISEVVVDSGITFSLNAEAQVLKLSAKATKANVSVLDSVEELLVEANDAYIDIAASGKIDVATILSDRVELTGSGKVTNASIEGSGVSVSNFGAVVEGENVYEGNKVDKIVVTDMEMTSGGAEIFENSDGSVRLSFPGQYKSATYTIPKSIPKGRVTMISLDISAASQFGITLKAGKGSDVATYPGYGMTSRHRATYDFSVNTATTMISSISIQSLASGTPDIVLHSITFYLKPETDNEATELWSEWKEDYSDATLNISLPVTAVDMNYCCTYEHVSDGYGKYTCTNNYGGLCIVLDNTDSSKAAEFNVSAVVKKVGGSTESLRMIVLNEWRDLFKESVKLGSDWNLLESVGIQVEAGESKKIHITPCDDGINQMTFLVDELTVARTFKEGTTEIPKDEIDLTGATKCNTDEYQVHHFKDVNLVEYAGKEVSFSVDMVCVDGYGDNTIVAQDSAYNAMYTDAEIGKTWKTYTYTLNVPEDYSTKENAYLGFRWKKNPVTNYSDYVFYYKNFRFSAPKDEDSTEDEAPKDGILCTPDATNIVEFKDIDFRELVGKTVNISVDVISVGGSENPKGHGQFNDSVRAGESDWFFAIHYNKEIGTDWTSFGSTEFVVPEQFADETNPVYFAIKSASGADYSPYKIYYKNFKVEVLEEEEEITEFYIAQNVEFKDVVAYATEYGGTAEISTNHYLDGNNFVKLLPDELKNNADVAAKFTTLAGLLEVVDYFEVEVTLTEGTAISEEKAGYAPQSQVYLQDSNYSVGTWGSVIGNVGQPVDGQSKTGIAQHPMSLCKEWTSATVGKIGIQMINVMADTKLSGSYSIKVVLK